MSQTVFKPPRFLASTSLAGSFAQGASSFAVADPTIFGTLDSAHPVRFTIVAAAAVSDLGLVTDRTRAADYTATGLSGSALTGVAFDGAGTDQSFAPGDLLSISVSDGTLSEIHTAVNNLESASTTQATAIAGKLSSSANLADLASASAARGNLGLGSASTHAATDFEPAGAPASFSPGDGLTLFPIPGSSTPSLAGSRGAGSWVDTEPIQVHFTADSAVNDTTYQTLDLSAFVPPGATHVRLTLYLYCASSTDIDTYFAVRAVGNRSGGFAPDGTSDGCVALSADPRNGIYAAREVILRISPDRKIEYRRVNPNASLRYWRIFLDGHCGAPCPVTGGLKLVVNAGQNSSQYASFPWTWTAPETGSRFVAYRDWNGTNAATHSTGGAYWLIRNEGNPAKVFDAASVGAQVQDAFLYHNPSAPGTLIAHLRLYDGVSNYSLLYATSTDDGVTFSTTSAMTIPNDFQLTININFLDFQLSADGTHLLATVFGNEVGNNGASETSVALWWSPDGFTWTHRAWITRNASIPGDETGLVRMPYTAPTKTVPRLMATIRNVDSGAVTNGYTCYSDDDGATWTTPVQQGINNGTTNGTALWQCPRGFPLGPNRYALFCRSRQLTIGLGTAYWLLDNTGTIVFGPVTIWQQSNPSNGGYVSHPIREADGVTYLYFHHDLNNAGNPAPVLCKTPLNLAL